MTDRADAMATLRRIGGQADEEIDLAEGALALAALGRPRVGLDRYRDHLAEIAHDVSETLAGATAAGDVLGAMNAVLLERHGYAGDTLTYDDVQNANLMRVIDRKKGLPVALGILYIVAARGCGVPAEGLNFPGHFLIRIGNPADAVIADPFNEGAARDAADLRELLKATAGLDAELRPEHYAAVGNRDVLIRLHNNIKTRQVKAGRIEEALDALEAMRLIAPDAIALWRESGMIQARLGNLGAAIEAFQTIVDRADSDAARHDAARIIQKLRRQLN